MTEYQQMDRTQLEETKAQLESQYQGFVQKGLKLDMSRGKPSSKQLELSAPLLTVLQDVADLTAGGTEYNNYGVLEGIPSARGFMGELLGVSPENVFIGGSSSLNLMHDCVSIAYIHGVPGGELPWGKQPVKFLCPCPGYDRHFAVSQHFGFELLPVDMNADGPDMDQVEELVKDPTVKGLWCVPKYSNPTGVTCSAEVVRRLAQMTTAAPDFRIFWDNAYVVHHLDWEDQDQLASLPQALEEAGNPDRVLQFTSTSKITFPGGGISCVAVSDNNMVWLKKHMGLQTICNDKINQLRHTMFLPDLASVKVLMMGHAQHLIPKFRIVTDALSDLNGLGIAWWKQPKGGYFIALDVLPGCAKRVVALCKEAGVAMTPAGATHPHGMDPKDQTIRIAPTYPPVEELKQAAQLLCLCIKLASVEAYLSV